MWLGQQAYYNAFDSLDSFVVWYRMVIDGGFADAPPATLIPQIMGGIPKFVLVNTSNIYFFLNRVFSTFQALNIQILLASFTGLLGMWLLLRQYFRLEALVAAFLSLSFAFTPFLPTWTLSIAGQPLLLFALLNLRNRKAGWWNWAIVVVFPFVSNFQSAGVFILAVLAVWILVEARNRRPVRQLLIAAAVMLILYTLGRINLLDNLLAGQDFVSHRTEIQRYPLPPLVCLVVFARFFLFGNIDVALSLHTAVLLPFILVGYVFLLVKDRRADKMLTLLLLAIVAICAYVALLNWEPVVDLRNKIRLLRMFSMDRFHIFLQLLWHLAAARTFVLLGSRMRKGLRLTIIGAQLLVCFAYQPTWYKLFVEPVFRIKPYQHLYRYADYYAESMFSDIRKQIGEPSENKVACIGFPPAIAQYNGLYTIDGYVPNYPLPYKKAFRKIIAAELDGNPTLGGFFDAWGSQCIVLYEQNNGNFNTHVTKDLAPPQRPVRLDGAALAALGCKYVLSAETITTPEASGLRPLSVFTSRYWKLTLYQVN
ncbi:DUF6044 family protein [Ravibacter arvi]|uniref:DUF6044 family protein n=1 Tax=Ravibacter arvi TaxID=2051041 RepID=A0ABP8LVX4_9BACT